MLKPKDVQCVLERALSKGADFAELFFEDKDELNIKYNRSVTGIAQLKLAGAGFYVIRGKKSVYVYTNELVMPAMMQLVDTATELLAMGGSLPQDVRGTSKDSGGGPITFSPLDVEEPCPVVRYPGTVAHSEKIRILEEADKKARSVTPNLKDIQLDFFDTDQRVLIANSEGVWAEDRRVTSRIRFVPTISNSYGSIGYFSDSAYPAGVEAFQDGSYLTRIEKVIEDMEASLSADEAPSGRMTVILEGGDCTGTFFPEACGHQFETNTLRRGGLFWDKRGQKVASHKVTLIDDGTVPCLYGSSKFDDEGMPRQKNILIKDGILVGFLADRLGSLALGVPRTGSGRRQGYANAPAARMSNTYLAPGTDDEDEMIRSTDLGLFVTRLGGGSGGEEFTIMAQTAFLIENGQIVKRVRGAMLVGRGDETMLKIDRVGKVLKWDEAGGAFCGGASGFCPTTTSGPRIRIQEMVVGGKGGAL